MSRFKKILTITLIAFVLIAVAVSGFFIYLGNRSTRGPLDDAKIPLIKHIGIELAEYDPTTMRAGDVIFGLFFLVIGLIIMFNKKEDEIEKINQTK